MDDCEKTGRQKMSIPSASAIARHHCSEMPRPREPDRSDRISIFPPFKQKRDMKRPWYDSRTTIRFVKSRYFLFDLFKILVV